MKNEQMRLAQESHEIKKENRRLKKEIKTLAAMQSCYGCKHEPKSGDPYPTPCGECSRWWSDKFEALDNKTKNTLQ